MAIFIHGQINDPTNPLLQLFIVEGQSSPIDASVVGFRILDITTETKKCYYARQDFNKIQVHPAQGAEYINVNALTTDPIPGHKISTGNYYAPWGASPTLRVGEYVIIWEWKVNAVPAFQITKQSFSVQEVI